MAFDALATLTAFLPIILVIAVFRMRWLRPGLTSRPAASSRIERRCDMMRCATPTGTVLQLHHNVSSYTRPDRSPDGIAPAATTPALRELALDAEALYQVADRAYRDHEYVLPAKH